jgi:hypothetical protein
MDSYDFNTGLNAVYDPKTDAWTFERRAHAAQLPIMVFIGGKIVVFGEATGGIRDQRGLRPQDRHVGDSSRQWLSASRTAWRNVHGSATVCTCLVVPCRVAEVQVLITTPTFG